MGKNKIRLIAAALLLVWLAIMAVIFVRSSVRRLRSALETELARLESGGTALEVIAFPGGEVRKFSGAAAEAAAAAGLSLEYGGVERNGAIRPLEVSYRVFIDTAEGRCGSSCARTAAGAWTVRGASPSV